jgi:predicted Fe-Mo cluster-binding NifX family protein
MPTTDNRGLDAALSPHFGRAPWFTIVNTESGSVEQVRNGVEGRVHGSCAPTDEIVRRGVEGVLCRGIGRGASARLAACGIAVYLTEEVSAAAAVEALGAGKARALDGAGACNDTQGGGSCHGSGAGHHRH